MAYASTEYEFWGNPKVRAAGKDAALLYIAANGHCNQFMTDGFIADTSIDTIASLAFQKNPKKAIEALVENRLWYEVDGGYLVHDYLKHNKSKAQIESLISKRSSAGKAGADTRYKADDEASAMASAMASAKQMPCDLPRDTSISINLTTTTTTREELVGSIFKAYEHEIGMITPTVADDIKNVIEDYPLDWFVEAFKEAARNNKRNWRYALAILKRWKVDGFKVDTRQKQPTRGNNGNNGGSRRVKPDLGDYVPDKSGVIVVTED
jgi:DnaD/phage-associated family protein